MELLETIQAAWAFTGLVPRSILDVNRFGNVLVEDDTGAVWRITPEELSCERIASSSTVLERQRQSTEFQTDWNMERLVSLATSELGAPTEGRCFCLKIPAVLGGKYELENLATISILELISFAGDLASQIKDLPVGTNVRLTVK
jgi:hypothetical protein